MDMPRHRARVAKGIRSLNAAAQLRKLVDEVHLDPLLTETDRFRKRVDLLERFDAFDLNSRLQNECATDSEVQLCRRAFALRSKLEAANLEMYECIRETIRRGHGRDALLRWAAEIETEVPSDRYARNRDTSNRDTSNRSASNLDASNRDTSNLGTSLRSAGESYDYLDELVSGVLGFAKPCEPEIELSAEMVPYQPTPARHVFDLLDRLRLTAKDVFVDLGSGLGHVALLVAICTDAGTVGIELEPSYVECARRSTEQLNLANAKFLMQDAREADLSSGSVFYLYTPFRGAILRTVLDRLQLEAKTRMVRVCTFGPCTPMVAAEPWLTIDAGEASHVSVFRSRFQL